MSSPKSPFRRTISLVLSGLLLALGVSCSNDSFPTAPPAQAPPSNAQDGLLGDLFGTADQLLFCPTSETYTATETIGPDGGTIVVGPHWLRVPSGALTQPTTITATAPAGNVVRVQFQPEGLVFASSATLSLSYRQCGLLSVLGARIVYVDDALSILEQVPSFNDLFGRRVTGRIRHFSSYALAF